MLKVLIIEDEAGIRNSIANAFSWEEMGCELFGAAGSGLQALELCLNTPPDLVISDIVMPGIDGLTFLKYIREKYPFTQFIILTGHRNFDYAKDALNLGAAFFMLKPINFIELENSIRKLIEKIMQERENKKIETQQEHILRSLLNGRIYHNTSLLPQVKNLLNQIAYYRVCVLKFDDEIENDPFRLQNLMVFCENLTARENLLMVKTDNAHLVFILLLSQKDASFEDMKGYLIQLLHRIFEFFHVSVSAGVSEIRHGYDTLHEAYIQGLRALGQKFFTGSGCVHMFHKTGSLPAVTDYNQLLGFCQDILTWLGSGNPDSLSRFTDRLFSELLASFGSDASLLKSSFLILFTLCIQRTIGEDARQMSILLERYSNFQKVIHCENIEILKELMLNLIMDLADYHIVKSGTKQMIVQKITDFIDQNYQENISLNDAARVVYLSPSYLCTLITNETGKNFTEILNEVRVKNAIELLKDPSRKISEIAYAVGFHEPQYFSIIFKKLTDLTPRDYRKMYLN